MSDESVSKVLPGSALNDRIGSSRAHMFAGSFLLTFLLVGAALFSNLAAANAAERSTHSAAHPAGTQQLSLYAVATKKAFINNTDDLARGEGHNPFGNYSSSTINTKSNEKVFGPFAGDAGVYSFALFTSASKKTSAGSAIFICQYGFDQNAFCDAAFQLKDGTLIGKGRVQLQLQDLDAGDHRRYLQVPEPERRGQRIGDGKRDAGATRPPRRPDPPGSAARLHDPSGVRPCPNR